MRQINLEDKPYLRWATLFITSGTLLCCALPVLLVSMGFGAIVASLNFKIPALLMLAENGLWTLGLSAIMVCLLAWIIWKPNQTCPTDPALVRACQSAKSWNQGIFWLSLAVWSIGFFFTVLLMPLRNLLF